MANRLTKQDPRKHYREDVSEFSCTDFDAALKDAMFCATGGKGAA